MAASAAAAEAAAQTVVEADEHADTDGNTHGGLDGRHRMFSKDRYSGDRFMLLVRLWGWGGYSMPLLVCPYFGIEHTVSELEFLMFDEFTSCPCLIWNLFQT